MAGRARRRRGSSSSLPAPPTSFRRPCPRSSRSPQAPPSGSAPPNVHFLAFGVTGRGLVKFRMCDVHNLTRPGRRRPNAGLCMMPVPNRCSRWATRGCSRLFFSELGTPDQRLGNVRAMRRLHDRTLEGLHHGPRRASGLPVRVRASSCSSARWSQRCCRRCSAVSHRLDLLRCCASWPASWNCRRSPST